MIHESKLTDAQLLTELELGRRLEEIGETFERREVNTEREPFYVSGKVQDVLVVIYHAGDASVIGKGANLMIERESYESPAALRRAIVESVVTTITNPGGWPGGKP